MAKDAIRVVVALIKSRQIVATQSDHNIHLQQPEFVVDAIKAIVRLTQYPDAGFQKGTSYEIVY